MDPSHIIIIIIITYLSDILQLSKQITIGQKLKLQLDKKKGKKWSTSDSIKINLQPLRIWWTVHPQLPSWDGSNHTRWWPDEWSSTGQPWNPDEIRKNYWDPIELRPELPTDLSRNDENSHPGCSFAHHLRRKYPVNTPKQPFKGSPFFFNCTTIFRLPIGFCSTTSLSRWKRKRWNGKGVVPRPGWDTYPPKKVYIGNLPPKIWSENEQELKIPTWSISISI